MAYSLPCFPLKFNRDPKYSATIPIHISTNGFGSSLKTQKYANIKIEKTSKKIARMVPFGKFIG